MEQAGLRGAGAHVHLLDAAVYGTCKEESGLPGRLRLLPHSSRTPEHSPQSTKRRGSARAVAAAPSARSRASGDGTMAAAGTAALAAAAPRCHMSGGPARPSAGAGPARGPGHSHPRPRRRGRGQACRRERAGGSTAGTGNHGTVVVCAGATALGQTDRRSDRHRLQKRCRWTSARLGCPGTVSVKGSSRRTGSDTGSAMGREALLLPYLKGDKT